MRIETMVIDGETVVTRTDKTRAYVAEMNKKAEELLWKDPELMKRAVASWLVINTALRDRVMAKRPQLRPASFYVHHLSETLRMDFLCDIAEGMSPEDAEVKQLAASLVAIK